jgi:hypothetical protein
MALILHRFIAHLRLPAEKADEILAEADVSDPLWASLSPQEKAEYIRRAIQEVRDRLQRADPGQSQGQTQLNRLPAGHNRSETESALRAQIYRLVAFGAAELLHADVARANPSGPN